MRIYQLIKQCRGQQTWRWWQARGLGSISHMGICRTRTTSQDSSSLPPSSITAPPPPLSRPPSSDDPCTTPWLSKAPLTGCLSTPPSCTPPLETLSARSTCSLPGSYPFSTHPPHIMTSSYNMPTARATGVSAENLHAITSFPSKLQEFGSISTGGRWSWRHLWEVETGADSDWSGHELGSDLGCCRPSQTRPTGIWMKHLMSSTSLIRPLPGCLQPLEGEEHDSVTFNICELVGARAGRLLR